MKHWINGSYYDDANGWFLLSIYLLATYQPFASPLYKCCANNVFLWFNRELDLSDRIKSKADEDGYEISGWRMKAELEELRSPREVNLVWTGYLIYIIIIFRWKLVWFKTRLFFQQMLQLWIRFEVFFL